MTTEKMLAAARKAARRMARATSEPYQACLDQVARQAGRDHWSAFLLNPVMLERSMDDGSVPHVEPLPSAGNEAFKPAVEQVQTFVLQSEMPWKTPDPAPSFRERLARLIGATERGVVNRSISKRMIARKGRREHRPSAIPLGTTVANGYEIVLAETLPVLAIAPPGSGKSAAVTIPAILSCDKQSLIVHDCKDLVEVTSGHRATLGPVTILDLAGSRSVGSLNPLSSSWIPREEVHRSSYIAMLAKSICPEDDDAAEIVRQAVSALVEDGGTTTFAMVAERIDRSGSGGREKALRMIAPFLAPAVAACTTSEGMTPGMIRRDRRSPGSHAPCTLYIVRGLIGDRGQGAVAAAIQQCIWWWMLDESLTLTGTTVILEDVHRLPRMPSFLDALEAGRARGVSHLVTAPSYQSLSRIYDVTAEAIDALFALQIVLPQTDMDTVRHLMHRLKGATVQSLIKNSRRDGAHYLALQYEWEPLIVKTPFYFRNPDMMARAYNPRTNKGPKPLPR